MLGLCFAQVGLCWRRVMAMLAQVAATYMLGPCWPVEPKYHDQNKAVLRAGCSQARQHDQHHRHDDLKT